MAKIKFEKNKSSCTVAIWYLLSGDTIDIFLLAAGVEYRGSVGTAHPMGLMIDYLDEIAWPATRRADNITG